MDFEFHPKRRESLIPLRKQNNRNVKYVIFDCETKATKINDDIELLNPFLICSQVLYLTSKGQSRVSNVWVDYTIDEFHDRLDRLITIGKTTRLIAHNSQFDVTVCKVMQYLAERGYEIEVYNPFYGSYLVVAFKGKTKVHIVDNTNFFAGSLSNLGKELGFNKLVMPENDESMETWITYCKRDVEIITKALQELSKIMSQWNCGDLSMTRASLAMLLYRGSFMNHNIKIHMNEHAMNLEIQAYYGGRTENFVVGKQPKQPYYYLDFNSLYPSVMADSLFSLRLRGRLKQYNPDDILEQMKIHNIVASVIVDIDKPCLPYRADRTLLFPIGKFQTTLAMPELEYAIKQGYVTKVLDAYAYHRSLIFKDYVDTLHKYKTESKKNGNPIETLNYKLLLNSLYGKFGQKRMELVDTGLVDEEQYGTTTYINMVEKYMQVRRILNHKIYVDSKPRISPYSVPIIAAEVSSYGRMKLWKAMEQCGLENVYYVDTDSVFTNQTGYDRIQSEIKNGQLGALELELTADDYTVYAPKDYVFGTKTVTKGVHSRSTVVGKNTYRVRKFATQQQVQMHAEFDTVYTYTMDKQLKRVPSKSIIREGQHAIPWNLSTV